MSVLTSNHQKRDVEFEEVLILLQVSALDHWMAGNSYGAAPSAGSAPPHIFLQTFSPAMPSVSGISLQVARITSQAMFTLH